MKKFLDRFTRIFTGRRVLRAVSIFYTVTAVAASVVLLYGGNDVGPFDVLILALAALYFSYVARRA